MELWSLIISNSLKIIKKLQKISRKNTNLKVKLY